MGIDMRLEVVRDEEFDEAFRLLQEDVGAYEAWLDKINSERRED